MASKNQNTLPSEPPGHFSINGAAKYLNVHRSTVERLLHSGELGKDWWRIGRKIIIPKANIFDFERREREKRLTVIELVDEEPTEEMIHARERFWEKVFVELLTADQFQGHEKSRIPKSRTSSKSRIYCSLKTNSI